MEMEPVAGYQYANWQRGYGDFHLAPDLQTLRCAAWLDRTAIVLCDVQDPASGALVPIAPRSLLKRQIERATALGYTAKAASELEYYTFENSYRDSARRNFQGLEPSSWYLEDYHALQGAREESFNGAFRRRLSESGVSVEGTKGEWGLGQHELNVRYDEALRMADTHVLCKQCLKEVADQQQISLTFMAKFAEDGAGSSCHIHLSLWREGKNAFADGPTNSTQKHGAQKQGAQQYGDIFRWFLGGWLAHAAEFMVFYAPNVNSYKRFQAGSWAPTKLAWSRDNRTAGFRVVGSGQSLRIECRTPGADCNPYLAFAAALASGPDGIENKIEPPACYQGDVYAAADLPQAPTTLHAAIRLFEASAFVEQTLGKDVAEHYLHFFRSEQNAYDKAVTDWERRRYFERI